MALTAKHRSTHHLARDHASAEEKLAGIIQAQIAGGFRGYQRLLSIPGSLQVADKLVYFGAKASDGVVVEHCRSLLDVLLDPQGLMVTYTGARDHDDGDRLHIERERSEQRPIDVERNAEAAHTILDAWLASEGDPEKTIDVAYSLLTMR